MLNNRNINRLFFSIIICNLAGIFGAFFVKQSIDTWYVDLNKSALNPPGWVFGPVWTTLYVLMGISLFIIWNKNTSRYVLKRKAIIAFSVQLVLNALWSFFFFGLRSPFYSLIENLFLLISLSLTILLFYRLSKKAAYFLYPYFLWNCFALYLNYQILVLNT